MRRKAICLLTLMGALFAPTLVPAVAQAEVVPIVFPVSGGASYSNDYGAPRSGGRTHGGNDLFAPKLRHLVAAENGYVNWWLKNQGLSGNMLELVGESGYRYWYIHVNNDNPGTDDGAGGDRWAWAPGIEPGAPVRAGQFIAYLGDSGNAEGTSPHLHFEIHYPDGTRFNPYDSLNAATHWEEPDPTGGFAFHEYLTIQNPGDTSATIAPKYVVNDGTPPQIGDTLVVPPRSRRTVRVNDAIPYKEVSTELSSTVPIVAERPMYFGYGPSIWTGGHVGMGLQSARTTTYFAEGYTGAGFEQYLTLANMNPTEATVDIEYLVRGGGNVNQRVVVPANRRSTVNFRGSVGDDKQVSAVVRSDIPILAERPMYFDYNGWTGGHVSSGVQNPAQAFYFAEGYTGDGFDEYLTVANPTTESATVTVNFLFKSGAPIPYTFPVGPLTRETLNVRALAGHNKEVSMRVTSDTPIVAERPMYFNKGWSYWLGPVSGGHVAVGATAPLSEWLFAEGYTGTGFQEYLTLQNPNPTSTSTTIEYQGQGGIIKTTNVSIPANSRFTVDVNGDIGDGKEVSVRVTANQPIVAERPMYFRYLGVWTGGHVTVGAPAASGTWLFSEGYTG